jgi:hypothetical protein
MCIQIYFILCRSKNIDNPPPTGLYSKVKVLHASRTYGIAFQEASGGISCTGTCISPKLPPQRVIARLLNHTRVNASHASHERHTVVLIPSDAAGFYTVEMYPYMYRTAVPCRTCGYMVSVPVLAKG